MTFSELTDPAYEIAQLGQWLHAIPEVAKPTYQVLSDRLGVEAGGTDYLEILTAARTRLERVRKLAASFSSPAFPKQRQDDVETATHNLAGIFHPARQHLHWTTVRKEGVRVDDGLALAMFSPFARQLRPLRLIAVTESAAVNQKVQDAIAELDALHSAPQWAREQLILSLRRLKLTLEHLPFFGHEAAIDDIITLSAKAATAAKFSTSWGGALTCIAGVIGAAAALFILPADIINSAKTYQDFYLEQVKPFVAQIEPQPIDWSSIIPSTPLLSSPSNPHPQPRQLKK